LAVNPVSTRAAKEHGEPALLGPALDGPCPGPDHPLGIGEDDEFFGLEGIQNGTVKPAA